MIRARAAVAWAAGEPLEVTEIEVAPPQAGEVLLKVVATGVCHTDAYTLRNAAVVVSAAPARPISARRSAPPRGGG